MEALGATLFIIGALLFFLALGGLIINIVIPWAWHVRSYIERMLYVMLFSLLACALGFLTGILPIMIRLHIIPS